MFSVNEGHHITELRHVAFVRQWRNPNQKDGPRSHKVPISQPEFPTRIEARDGRNMSPAEIFDVTNRREKGLSRLLVAYISSGLVFMLLPGIFLGVCNLIAANISMSFALASSVQSAVHVSANQAKLRASRMRANNRLIPVLKCCHWITL